MKGTITFENAALALEHSHLDFVFPAREAPAWAPLVDRWPQLDAYAYGLPELYQRLGLTSKPDFIFLASPESSNRTDFAFTQTGALSPAKFVHTLPNSRSAALLQVMNWAGPLLCVQSDPTTVLDGLREAAALAHLDAQTIWLFSVERRDEQSFTAHLFILTPSAAATEAAPTRPLATDDALFAFLRNRAQNPSLAVETVISNGLKLRL